MSRQSNILFLSAFGKICCLCYITCISYRLNQSGGKTRGKVLMKVIAFYLVLQRRISSYRLVVIKT